MTARWHLGPITGSHFWWVLVTSPEVLVFLFFMITDPKTAPTGTAGAARLRRRARPARLAADRADDGPSSRAKVALLGALAIVCARAAAARARSRVARLGPAPRSRSPASLAVAAYRGVHRRHERRAGRPRRAARRQGALPPISILPSRGVQTQLDRAYRAADRARLLVDRRAGRATRAIRVRLWLEPGERPGAAGRRRAARRPHVPARADGHALGALKGKHVAPTHAAADVPVLAGYRLSNVAPAVGLALPPGRVPLRRHERHAGDDGRRPLLARLQQRRLARPVRRQQLRRGRHRRVLGTRRAAAHRALPERPRPVRERHGRVRRRPRRPRRRLRRRRLQRRRLHRSLRHDGAERRAALEQRQRHVHRGRALARRRLVRLALRRRRRRRERRRPSRPLRRRLHGGERRRSPARSPASRRTTSACATCSS